MTEPRPASATEAVQRALTLVNGLGAYELGTGDYRPTTVGTRLIDVPWTERERDHKIGSDCAGFAISWCYKLRRHRPSYNRGGAFDVEDDINVNSAIGDATSKSPDLFELATGAPRAGDLLCYPSFRFAGQPFVGHVGIVIGTARAPRWDPAGPRYDLLDVAQCRGPDGRTPAVLWTDGSIWLHHREVWPKPEHTVYMLRVKS